jgi:hypothetical protein
LYYPPLWLALLIPAPLAFNILFFLHLAFAGVGAYLLAREEGTGEIGSLLAGIAFGGLPKLVAHVAAGHLTLVLAVAWTPWLLLAARDAARQQSLRRWALTGVMAGIIFLADPRWSIPSALAAVGYAFFSGGSYPPPRSHRAMILSWIKNLAVFVGFAAALSAVLALPMAEFVSLSTRANLSGSESATQSLPFLSLIGLLFGGTGSAVEWVIYPGVVVLVMALASLSRSPSPGQSQERGMRGEADFWLILFLLSVVLSLGSNLPGFTQLLDAIPGAGLLRVPPRWMFLAGLALAMLAGRGLNSLESVSDKRGLLKKAGFALTAGGLILTAAAAAMGLPAALWQDGLMWGGLGLILFFGFYGGRWTAAASTTLVFLAVVDLGLADRRMISPYAEIPDGAALVAFSLPEDAQDYRIYSPSYSIPPLTAVEEDVRMLDGVDPLILRSTFITVSTAAGVPQAGYSVTLPGFATGQPKTDNRDAVPDWRLMGLLNVRYIASAFDIRGSVSGGCHLTGRFFLCRNLSAMPRAWVAQSLDTWDAPRMDREVVIESETPNRMVLRAAGSGLLVVSEAAYPAWRVAVDGKDAELIEVGGWWRAVEIGPGEHIVEMTYNPVLSLIGLAVTMLALLAYWGVRRWAA